MKILVGYDGSGGSENVLDLVRKYAKAFNATFFFMTIMEQGPELNKEDIEKAESKLEKIKLSLSSDGIPCETRALVSFQPSGEELVNFAANNGIDEIIIGVRKKSKVGKLMFGSTAQYVILSAPCPVVAVK
jgi:nucleotide-binding universal stress UspA family protein